MHMDGRTLIQEVEPSEDKYKPVDINVPANTQVTILKF